MPSDLRKALAAAAPKARALWSDITPIARRDRIHWITSAAARNARAADQKCLLDASCREAARLLTSESMMSARINITTHHQKKGQHV